MAQAKPFRTNLCRFPLASNRQTGELSAHAQGLQLERFRFHFYSDEGHPREPLHIHVERDDADCKFWLYPEIRLAYNQGFNARTVKQLIEVVEARRTDIERAWNEHLT